jgi:tripartite-type tricarboxylate transporter receptor subunit TctC
MTSNTKASLTRRSALAAAGIALALGASPASAQTFKGPVKIVVPSQAGGTSDLFARIIAPGVSKAIGQPVVVENRPGAANNIGAGYVANGPSDGHTLLIVDVSALAISANLLKDLNYKLKSDLTGVTMLSFTPYVLGINKDLPPKNAVELKDFAGKNPDKINAGSSGPGALSHLTSVTLTRAWNAEAATQVPYRGIAGAVAAVVSGEASMVVGGVETLRSFIESKQIRGIAVSGPVRLPWAPDLPTFAELGWPMPNAGSWQGILVQSKTPGPVIDALYSAVKAAVAEPEIAKRIKELGGELRTEGPAQLNTWLDSQTADLGKFLREANVQAP